MIRPLIRILTLLLCVAPVVSGQRAPLPLPVPKPKAPPVEKLGDNQFRVGNVRVDTAKHELKVSGRVNDTQALEFIAGTTGGAKNYETAFELDTDAVMFNTALILIGLDKSKGVPSKYRFDPTPPQGDPIEIWIDWDSKDGRKNMRAEDVVWNIAEKGPLGPGQWVYTGSTTLDDGRFLAEMAGVIVGFVHAQEPLIERTTFRQTAYGMLQLNPNVGLTPGTVVTFTVKALPKAQKN